MASYDAYQTTFYLSMLANITSHFKTRDVTTLGEQYLLAIAPKVEAPRTPVAGHMPATVQPAVQALIGDWSLKWGPSVVIKDSAASNSLFVAYRQSVEFEDGAYPTYVVAIAGTDPYSAFDWIVEDANVVSIVPWEAFVSAEIGAGSTDEGDILPPLTKPYISKGTADGVNTLTTMLPTPSGVETGKILHEFLSSVQGKTARVIFTGHSLGGALSPALALYLQEKGALSGFEKVLVYPSAGPTPGNEHFRDRFKSAFPPAPHPATSYKAWNTNITNGRDVVPHAWASVTMAQIPAIYGNDPASPLPDGVKDVIRLADGLVAAAAAKGMVYARIPHWIDDRPYDGYPPNSLSQFLSVLGQEHVQAYSNANVFGTEPGIIVPEAPIPYWNLIPLLDGVSFR
jgi:hypothetical protein